jgi:hypothetical protein
MPQSFFSVFYLVKGVRIFLALLALSIPEVSVAIEEPAFETLMEEGAFSLRKYGTVLLAETEVEGAFEEAGNRAFGKLAGYIFGKNDGDQKIAMTAPVGMEALGTRYKVHFTMPGKWTLRTLPVPFEKSVRLIEQKPRKMAVVQYSGSWSEQRYREHEQALRRWMTEKGLKSSGEPIFARYNSPWTLWFLRRNEVWIPVETGDQ